MNVTGIILAGGKSSRMGKNKAFVEYSGRRLIDYSISVLEKFCSQIIISANTDEYNHLGFQIVADYLKDCGPIAGLYSGLKASETDDNFVVACDMPHISSEIMEKLIGEKEHYQIVCPELTDGKIEPLFAYYNKSVLKNIEEQIQKKEFSLHRLIRSCNTRYISIDDISVFKNINTIIDIQ